MNAEIKHLKEAAENQRSTSLKTEHAFWKTQRIRLHLFRLTNQR
jgi:hypothetical protein